MGSGILIYPSYFFSLFDSQSAGIEREVLNGNGISFNFGWRLCWANGRRLLVWILCEIIETANNKDC